MISKEKLHEYIDHLKLRNLSALCGEESESQLRALAEEFPYFGTAQLLYLIVLKERGGVDFNRQLQKTALILGSESILRYHLDGSLIELSELIKGRENQAQKSKIETLLKSNIGSLTSTSNDISGVSSQKESLHRIAQELKESREVESRDSELADETLDNEPEEFITETLANIYTKQGLFKEAISSYKKLSLKYPQKSSYFANRISDIERLIKK